MTRRVVRDTPVTLPDASCLPEEAAAGRDTLRHRGKRLGNCTVLPVRYDAGSTAPWSAGARKSRYGYVLREGNPCTPLRRVKHELFLEETLAPGRLELRSRPRRSLAATVCCDLTPAFEFYNFAE